MKKIKKILNELLGTVGLRIQRVPKRFLKSSNTGSVNMEMPYYSDVQTVIDIGVSGGTPWLYHQFPTQDLILIEPLNVVPELYKLIKGRNYEIHECAVGETSGTIEINYDKTQPAKSSIKDRTDLTISTDNEIETRTVPIKTLDEVMARAKFSSENLGLKIDTEGYELDVLKGAVETLKKCKFVACEASIEKRFEESYDFSELIVFMNEMNFKLVKVLAFCKDRRGVTRFADVLFEPKK